MSTAHFEWDLSQWYALIDQMIDTPLNAINALEGALETAFLDTQSRVHVLTGSLRGSGKVESDVVAGVWSGTIEYGGEAEGQVKNPVVYAEYERARGGDHDFLAGVAEYDLLFLEAMTDWFS